MPKKSSLKTPSKKAETKEEGAVLEQKKSTTSTSKKASGNEIDEIFAGKKKGRNPMLMKFQKRIW